MKKIKIVFASLILLFGLGLAQVQAEGGEPTITVVKTVDLSADKVWEQIRIMDNIDKLSSAVSKVKWTGPKGAGGERVCTAAEGDGYFRERILEFSDTERSYLYQVVEGVPAKEMINYFKVVDLGFEKSMIIWTTNFEFMENPQMTEEQFRGFIDFSIREMIDNCLKFARKS